MAGTLAKAVLSLAALAAGMAVVFREHIAVEMGLGDCGPDLAAISGDPVDAADAALDRGDTRLLAVQGYAIHTPGVSEGARSREYVILPNTSDAPTDRSCFRYNRRAADYAERYNRRILERRQTGWDAEDPRRLMIVAVSPSDAATVEAAARSCGLEDQERLSRSGLAWIVMRDVLASDSDSNPGVACLARWAMANPRTRVMFFGKHSEPVSDE